jgi:Flp pilus assembly pilin Flp
MRHIRKFWRSSEGATAIEYAFICALIVLVVVAGILTLGGGVNSRWSNVANNVAAAM